MPARCAVLCCNNNVYRLKRSFCGLHNVQIGFSGCLCDPPFRLFNFPAKSKDADGRRRWIELMNRTDTSTGENWEPTINFKVCSWHFVDGFPTSINPDPTLNLGYDITVVPKRQLPNTPSFLQPPKKFRKESSLNQISEDTESSCQLESIDKTEDSTDICIRAVTLDHCYAASQQEGVPSTETLDIAPHASSDHTDMPITNTEELSCPGCHSSALEIQQLSRDMQKLKDSLMALQSKQLPLLPKCALFICNNKQVRLNTGLKNKAALNSLFNLLKARADRMRYWKGPKRMSTTRYRRNYRRTPRKSGPKRILSCKDEFVLTLMKLRLGLTNQFLSNLFGISAGTCSAIINTWITFLARELQCLVFWPDRNQIRSFMPKSLRLKYPSLRCTIDCSETFIERPRDLKLQACTWSDYKKHNTLKYLIAITPDGMISFVSNAWGGRATDRYIVQNSGFLDLIEPYDLIMADRGFTIREDLMFRNATLEIPPPSAGLQQMSRSNVLKTKKIANARIHVERAINRIKWFKILSSVLPLSLIPLFDKILVICAALSNLLDPLVK